MKKGKVAGLFAALGALFVLAMPGVARAATAPATTAGGATSTTNGNAANGLRVSPVRDDLTVNPGESKTISFSVTNVTSATAALQTVVNDFVAGSGENGQPALLLNPDAYSAKHSLKRFVQKVPNFTLRPGEQKTINVTISIPKDAPGGGYFGAVRFAPSNDSDSNQSVTLAGSVGSLILAKVPGDITEKMSLATFDVRQKDAVGKMFTSTKNVAATLRFQNEGNVQEAPFGKLILKDGKGKILGQYEINSTEPRGNVLPDSVRRFDVALKDLKSFGRFKLEGNFGYGSTGQLIAASTSFYVLPLGLIILAVLGVLLLGFLIFGLPRVIKAYNRRIVQEATRAKRS